MSFPWKIMASILSPFLTPTFTLQGSQLLCYKMTYKEAHVAWNPCLYQRICEDMRLLNSHVGELNSQSSSGHAEIAYSAKSLAEPYERLRARDT